MALRWERRGWGSSLGCFWLLRSVSSPPVPLLLFFQKEQDGTWVGCNGREKLWGGGQAGPEVSFIQHFQASPTSWPALFLCWVLFTCATFLQLLVQALKMPHLQPTWSLISHPTSVLPSSPVQHTRCLCGWCTYVWFCSFYFFFLEINFLFIAWGREKTLFGENKNKTVFNSLAGANLS